MMLEGSITILILTAFLKFAHAQSSYLVRAFAGSGVSANGGDGGKATIATLGSAFGLFADSLGSVYIAGTTRIRKVDTSGIISTFIGTDTASFGGDGGPVSSATLSAAFNVWSDSVGRILITDSGARRIRRVSNDIVATVVGSGATNAPISGIQATTSSIYSEFAVGDSVGNIFLGDPVYYFVLRVSPDGLLTIIAGSGGGVNNGDGGAATSAGIYRPFGIVADSVGSVYVTVDTGSIRKITSAGIITTYAGTGGSGYNGDGQAATSTQFSASSRQLVFDSSNSMYCADGYNYRVRMISSAMIVSTIAGNGGTTTAGNDGPATAASFANPYGLAIDSTHSIMVASFGAYVVRQLYFPAPSTSPSISPSSPPSVSPSIGPSVVPSYAPVPAAGQYTVRAYAGAGSSAFGGDGGKATAATLVASNGLCIDTVGSVYIASATRVRKVDSNGIISTFMGTDSAVNGGDGGPVTSATIVNAFSAWGDSIGRIFVMDTGALRVRLAVNNIVSTVSGTGGSGAQTSGVPATSAALSSPEVIRGDTVGNIYFGQHNNYLVRVSSNGILTVFGGTGAANNNGDGGPATSAGLNQPYGVYPDSLGSVYVTDLGSVRVISSSGIITTHAGTGTIGYNGDGLAATSTQLGDCRQIVFDNSNNLYGADFENNRLRVVSSLMIVSTIAGNGGSTTSGNDGPATSASLPGPYGIVIDTSHNVIFSSYQSFVVRQLFVPVPSASPSTPPSVCPSAAPSVVPSYAPVPAAGQYTVRAYAGAGSSAFGGDGGKATAATLVASNGLFADSVGSVYIASTTRVRKVDSSGIISTFMGTDSAVNGGDGGPVTSATIVNAFSAWGDSIGRIFVMDAGALRIRVMTNGIVSTLAGSSSPTAQYNGAQATSCSIVYAEFISGDSNGNIYIGQANNFYLAKVSSNGIFFIVAGTGAQDNTGDGGPATSAGVFQPYGVCVDSSGSVYTTTKTGIRKINSDGIIATYAGTGTAGYNIDGLAATSTEFTDSRQIVMDGSNNLHVNDFDNFRIRVVSSSMIVTTIAGNGVSSSSGNNGPATSASFYYPYGLAIDTAHNIMVSSIGGNVVRQLFVPAPSASPSVSPSPAPSPLPSFVPSTVSPTNTPSVGPFSAFVINSYAGISGNNGNTGNSGPASAASLDTPYGICQDTAGTLYITVAAYSVIRTVSNFGIISLFAGNSGGSTTSGIAATSTYIGNCGSVWADSVGSVFIVRVTGYVHSVNTGVAHVLVGTGVSSSLGDGGPGTSATLNGPRFVNCDSVGNVYISDSLSNKIRKLSSNSIISSFAGLGSPSFSGDNGLASSSELDDPQGVFADSVGNVFIADSGRIRKVSSSLIIETVIGNGYGGFNGDEIAATAATHSSELAVALKNGDIYFSDVGNHRIRFVPASSGIVHTVAGTGNSGSGGNGGPATSAQFISVDFICGNTVGDIFSSDSIDHTVRHLTYLTPTTSPSRAPSRAPSYVPMIAPFTYNIQAYAGQSGVYSFDDNKAATSGNFRNVNGIVQDTNGVTYIMDAYNYRVRRIDTSNIISTVCGNGNNLSSGNGGALSSATLGYPVNIWMNSVGQFFIIESNVVRYSSTIGTIHAFAGSGTSSAFGTDANGDGGTATSCSMNGPLHIVGDTGGVMYISDANNFKIRSVSVSGIISSVVGSGIVGFSGDGGAATAAQLMNPRGLFYSAGVLYFADSSSNRLRQFTIPTAIVSTIAGSTAGFNGDGLAATSTMMSTPVGIWRDSLNNVFIGDHYNVRIRMLSGSSSILYTVAGTGLNVAAGNDGRATSASFSTINWLWGSSSGSLVISDFSDNTVRKLINVSPTISPSTAPSDQPTTYSPSYEQSMSPTRVPSAIPSIVPTSCNPTYAPVAGPTRFAVWSYVSTTGLQSFSGDNGPASSATLYSPYSINLDFVSNMYIADAGNARVRRVAASGIITTFAGGGSGASSSYNGPASSVQFNSLVAAWADSIGNVFICEHSNLVRKVDISGIVAPLAGTYTASSDPHALNGDGGPATAGTFNYAIYLSGDTNGRIFVADYSNSRIRCISTGLISTLAGTGDYAYSGDNGPASSAAVAGPLGVGVDSNGNVYIGADGNHLIRKVQANNLIISSIAGVVYLTGFNGDGLAATSSYITQVYSFLWRQGDLYFSEQTNRRVRMISSSSSVMYSVAGNGVSSSTGDGGAATSASFYQCYAISGNTLGSIYVSDATGNNVRVLLDIAPTIVPSAIPTLVPSASPSRVPSATPSLVPSVRPSVLPTSPPVVSPINYFVVCLGGTGTSGASGDGGPATSANFNFGFGVFVDSVGAVYAPDVSKRVRRIGGDGIISTFAGSSSQSFSGDSGSATAAALNTPYSAWGDSQGCLFILDTNNFRIRLVTLGGTISTFAGSGTIGDSTASGDGSQATSASLGYSYFLCGDTAGNIVVSDSSGYRVRQIITTGIIMAVAGSGGYGFGGDNGAATSCLFANLRGIFIDSTGQLFVVDNAYGTVRVVLSTQIIVRIAGNIAGFYDGDGKTATSTGFVFPRGIYCDKTGTIFIADGNTARFRMVSNSAIVYTIAGNGVVGISGNSGPASSASFTSPAGIWGDSGNNLIVTAEESMVRKLWNLSPTQSPSTLPSVIPSMTPSSPTIGPSMTPSMTPSKFPTTPPIASPVAFNVMGLAGTGAPSTSGDGGQASSATINNVYGVFADSVATVYAADMLARIRTIGGDGIISTFAGTSSGVSSGDGGPATSATIKSPYAVWGDSQGKVYIADTSSFRVRMVVEGTISPYAGSGTAATTSSNENGDGGAATAALIGPVYHICGDSSGSIYLSDPSSIRYRKVQLTGIISTVAGSGFSGTGMENGVLATSCTFTTVRGVFMDSNGQLYVVDAGSAMIRVVLTNQIIVRFAGTGVGGFDGDGKVASSSALWYPRALCSYTTGNIFIADGVNARYRMVSSSGIIYTIAGNGLTVLAGNNGPATSASFVSPSGVWVNAEGNLVTGSQEAMVRKLWNLSPTQLPSALPTTAQPTLLPSCDPTRLPSSMSPSVFPTIFPSIYPTCGPTVSPSVIPTVRPSVDPSVGPTISPTTSPSAVPSMTPSLIPSALPSTLPSYSPTIVPIFEPSTLPSTFPSMVLTLSPVNPPLSPSVCPSIVPSESPSGNPTVLPSCEPTEGPSELPTFTPSDPPSESPTEVPTSSLSLFPSFSPTSITSIAPSVCPTVRPRVLPSITPSACPCGSPSAVPSTNPSKAPTAYPSAIPTGIPSVCPTFCPTESPTVVPSLCPSFDPSQSPTVGPSIVPSVKPSCDPSATPTTEPSAIPTLLPSVQPSIKPTDCPTMDPSEVPSAGPTMLPSLKPSCLPTEVPTRKPSLVPSVSPTKLPSTVPSILPSQCPSINPSTGPTVSPTRGPTAYPTVLSLAPNATPLPTAPTRSPTRSPSLVPSVKPTSQPVMCPTLKPTKGPSEVPSVKPSRDPTIRPSLRPTQYPSLKPSVVPSLCPSAHPSLRPTAPTTTPTQPRPSISPSPTVEPSISVVPSASPTNAPIVPPSISPSAVPSTISPSDSPTQSPSMIPSAIPSPLPSMMPSTITPSATPSSREFYESHPKATLPSNQSISVSGVDTAYFKIVLPFLSLPDGANGIPFSDVTLSYDNYGTSYILLGGATLSASSSVASGSAYSGAIAADTSRRSVSLLQDVNGDGVTDLIIGDPYSGKCYVLFGTVEGLINMKNGFTIFGEQDSDLTGWSVSDAGDLNNDTIHDIIVGAPFTNGVGAFYVVYGRRFNNFDIYLSNFTHSQGFVMYGSQVSDYLGISVSSAGDVNNDGIDDVIVGAVMVSLYYAGAAYIVYGGVPQAQSTASLGASQGYKLTGSSYQYAGYSVSNAGDVNQDGYNDVLIGSCPQRSSLVSIAYIVYGTPTKRYSVSLASLGAAQGVRILGGGVVVSYAGDVNRDGYDDIMIGGGFVPVDGGGYVVFTNISELTVVTAKPSVMPSFLPTFAPTIHPTTRAPISPSITPTKRPTDQPSVRPSAPTVEPTPGVTQPSSRPTAHPAVPSVPPSQPPTETPSETPTEEPSELPTVRPSVEPSELPSRLPSEHPSEMPSFSATTAPSSSTPTIELVSRAPFSSPTVLPTVAVTGVGVVYTVKDINTPGVVLNETQPYVNYVVNTTGKVTVLNGQGGNKYTIIPKAHSDLTIIYLNKTSDRIDLTAFEQITSFSQLLLTEGSVIITLVNDQTIHILNLHPSDMSSTNFIFYNDVGSFSKGNGVALSASKIVGIILGVTIYTYLCVWLYRYYEKRKIKDDPMENVFFYTITKNKDGSDIENILQEAEQPDRRVDDVSIQEAVDDDHESSRNPAVEIAIMENVASRYPSPEVSGGSESIDISAPSSNLSNHTVNSNGEVIVRPAKQKRAFTITVVNDVYDGELQSVSSSIESSVAEQYRNIAAAVGRRDNESASSNDSSALMSDFSVDSNGQVHLG